MARRSGEKSRNERLNSGPSTKLVSRGGRGNQNKKSGFNRSSGSRNKYGSGSNLKAPRNRRQMIIMAIVLIAFIFGILIGLSFIFDNHDTNQDDSPEFENVTGNISKYNESMNVTYQINATESNNTPNLSNSIYNRSHE